MDSVRALISVLLMLSVSTAYGQTYPECSQDHPGRQHRLESLAKNGDSRMAYSAAGHAVLYAVERYGLKDFVTKAETDAAMSRMYDFLKWKLVSPTAVATTWASNGYQHFDRAYVDEAAAALLGCMKGTGTAPLFVMPDWMIQFIVMSSSGTPDKALIAQALEKYGIPVPLRDELADKIMTQVLTKTFQAIAAVSALMPRQYDIDNRLIDLAVQGKKAQKSGQLAAAGAKAGGGKGGGLPTTKTATGSGGNAAAYEARIRELEAMVQDLQKTVADLEARLANPAKEAPAEAKPSGEAPAKETARDLGPTDIAYMDVDLKLTPPEGGRATVEVNGSAVGTHSQYADIRLNDLLRPGYRNQVKVTFTAPAARKAAGQMHVMARVKPESGWTTIHSFTPKEDQLNDTFDVPFRSTP